MQHLKLTGKIKERIELVRSLTPAERTGYLAQKHPCPLCRKLVHPYRARKNKPKSVYYAPACSQHCARCEAVRYHIIQLVRQIKQSDKHPGKLLRGRRETAERKGPIPRGQVKLTGKNGRGRAHAESAEPVKDVTAFSETAFLSPFKDNPGVYWFDRLLQVGVALLTYPDLLIMKQAETAVTAERVEMTAESIKENIALVIKLRRFWLNWCACECRD